MYKSHLKSKLRCASCFEPKLEGKGLFNLILTSPFLCISCNIEPTPQKIKLDEFVVESFYSYDNNFRKLLLQYKENNDKFLAPIFLHPILLDLSIKFRNHIFVCAPSRLESMKLRGFEHLQLMLEVYGFKTLEIFENDAKIDQTQSKNREDISKHIILKDIPIDTSSKIVLFDDVLTSGSTIKACYQLLCPFFEDITVIVLSSAKK